MNSVVCNQRSGYRPGGCVCKAGRAACVLPGFARHGRGDLLMEAERQSVRSWITEGIILAGIPVIAYLWSLLYEMAYSNYFSIPWYFISLSPVSVLAITRLYS